MTLTDRNKPRLIHARAPNGLCDSSPSRNSRSASTYLSVLEGYAVIRSLLKGGGATVEGPGAEHGQIALLLSCYPQSNDICVGNQETQPMWAPGRRGKSFGEAACILYFRYLPYARHSASRHKHWQEDEGVLSALRRTPV